MEALLPETVHPDLAFAALLSKSHAYKEKNKIMRSKTISTGLQHVEELSVRMAPTFKTLITHQHLLHQL